MTKVIPLWNTNWSWPDHAPDVWYRQVNQSEKLTHS